MKHSISERHFFFLQPRSLARKLQTRPIVSKVMSPEKASDIYTCLAKDKNPPLDIVFDWKKIK